MIRAPGPAPQSAVRGPHQKKISSLTERTILAGNRRKKDRIWREPRECCKRIGTMVKGTKTKRADRTRKEPSVRAANASIKTTTHEDLEAGQKARGRPCHREK